MTWVRLDDTFADDPRVERAGPLALALYVAALCYSNRHLTDGVVSKARIRRLQALDDPDCVIAALVENELWLDRDTDIEIVDFHAWQPTSEDVIAKREQAKIRQQRWRERQRNGVTNGVTNAPRNASSHAYPEPEPVPTRRAGRSEGSDALSGSDSAGAPSPPDAASEAKITYDDAGKITSVALPEPAWRPGE